MELEFEGVIHHGRESISRGLEATGHTLDPQSGSRVIRMQELPG